MFQRRDIFHHIRSRVDNVKKRFNGFMNQGDVMVLLRLDFVAVRSSNERGSKVSENALELMSFCRGARPTAERGR